MADLIPIPQERLGDRLEALKKEVRSFARTTRKQLLFRLASLNLEQRARLADEVRLIKSIRSGVRSRGLEVEAVRFSFARKGIFLERGVGRGRPAGSSAAERTKREWIRPTLEPALAELAELLAGEYADIAAAELSINIPGVYQTKIST